MQCHIGKLCQGFVKKLLFLYEIDMAQIKQSFVSLPKECTF